MEKAAAAGIQAGVRWKTALGASAAFGLAACVACPAAAQDAQAPAATVVAQAQIDMLHMRPPAPNARVDFPAGAGRVEVQTSTLPRLEAQDGGFQAPRLDVSLLPTRRSYGFSPVLGVGGIGPQRPPLPGLAAPRASFDLGLRWTQRLAGRQRVDITAWRRMNNEEDAYMLAQMQQPVYGARVELNLSPVRKTGFALDHGFIGLQLESGARISIKRKDGHPMFYYRTTF